MPDYRFFFATDTGGRYNASGADDVEASARIRASFGIEPSDLTLLRTVPVTRDGLDWSAAIPPLAPVALRAIARELPAKVYGR